MDFWETVVYVWNWVNFFMTIISLVFSLTALYKQIKGRDVVDSSVSFPIVPSRFEEVEASMPGYKAYAIIFPQMLEITDVGLAFLPVQKAATNFDITVDVASSTLLDESIFLELSSSSIMPVIPGHTTSTTTAAYLYSTQHLNLVMMWRDSTVMDGIINGTVDFSSVFPNMNMSLLCFQ